jgi:hypothetical protein
VTSKFVVRLLSADGALLAWAEVHAAATSHPRGASCPFTAPGGVTIFPIEADGVATQISVHWCDLDVARVQRLLEPLPVRAGQEARFAWLEPVWLVPGMRDVPLPAVTVRAPVQIAVPMGAIFAETA